VSRIVLASASPRRREILSTLGIAFEVSASDVDETIREGERPLPHAARLAREKARAVSARAEDAFVLGADTIVVIGAEVLGKPESDAHARAMITRLSGTRHDVVTAVALVRGGRVLEEIAVTTVVSMRALDAAAIDRYVASGEGRDKAGAYAAQGLASGIVERIEGSYTNVVGLPAAETAALLVKHGAIARWP
jgi:septum formation protein